MIESLRELVGIIKELPGMSLWILGGFLFYKVFVVGSIYGVIKLAINKTHNVLNSSQVEKTKRLDYETRPKEIIKKWTLLDSIMIDEEENKDKIKHLFYLLQSRPKGFKSSYIHGQDLDFAINSVKKSIRNAELEERKKV